MRRVLIAALLFVCPSQALTYRIACGSPGGVDAQGNAWTSDGGLAAGGLAWNVAGTQPIPYNHLRFSNPPGAPFAFSLHIPPGSYSVTLKFVEPQPNEAAGQRIFGVTLNGAQVLGPLDIFSVAGVGKPLDYSYPLNTSDGTVTVLLTPSVGNALISGIQIDGTPTPPMTIAPGPGISIMSPPPGGGPQIISTDSAAIPIYSVGLATNRPTACMFGQVYMATDSMVLSYCITPGPIGVWSGVPAPVAGLLVCSGSGTGPPPTLQQGTNPPTPPSVNGVPAVAGVGWDCAAMMAVSITKTDGTTLSILGTLMAVPTNPALIWTPYQW